MKVEHIGIAVKNIEEANATYRALLNAEPYKSEEVESEGVITSFFQVGESKSELLTASRDDSPVAQFLEQRGEGIHHLGFDVEDILAEIARLKEKGIVMINEEPKMGAYNKLVAILHPKSAHGVLVELSQAAIEDTII